MLWLLHWQLLVLMDLFALTTWVWYLKLMHPVLESLRNTDKQWLIDTLYAFNAGNVEKFQSLKTAWGQQVSRWLIKCKCKAVKFVFFFTTNMLKRISGRYSYILSEPVWIFLFLLKAWSRSSWGQTHEEDPITLCHGGINAIYYKCDDLVNDSKSL